MTLMTQHPRNWSLRVAQRYEVNDLRGRGKLPYQNVGFRLFVSPGQLLANSWPTPGQLLASS